jgi:general secretion pathway protein C
VRGLPNAVSADWARVLGTESPPVQVAAEAVAESTRFRLVGVIASSSDGRGAGFRGLAVITVDEKPARVFRTGAEIEPNRVLKEVSLRGAAIGPREGPAAIRLDLALLPPPATGTPSGASARAAPGAGPGSAPQVLPAAPLPVVAVPAAPTAAAPPVPPQAAASSTDANARQRKTSAGVSRLQLSAPNYLTNNPADLAPADPSAGPSESPQDAPAVRNDR